MYRLTKTARLAALAGVATVAACSATRDVLLPRLNGGNELFHSYVAIGNSITAGYQSAGINDSTQRQSFARLLAGTMQTQYHYPSIAGRGCPPPIANTQTGARVGNTTAAPVTDKTCDLRAAASATDVLNNVAVPGANSFDPTSLTGTRAFGAGVDTTANVLTSLFLGGKTQVQRALDARPTFVSIWIGNNDVLQPALSGLFQPVKSTPAQFQANYDLMMKQLTDSMPNLKGILVGVAKAQFLPTMVAAPLITTTTMTQLVGRPITVSSDCATSTSLVNVVSLVRFLRATPTVSVVACSKGIFPAPIGDLYVLDAAEQVSLNATIDAYNAYVAATASSKGFAYYDPNVLFQAKRASGEIPPFPNFASATATFGPLFSLDGVHPSGAGHVLLANGVISSINAKYGTTLAAVP